MAAADCFYVSDEDCFDDSKEMHIAEEVAWNKLLMARVKDGFSDGKYLGEESTIQSGFNHGYTEGFELTFQFSIIKGLLAVNESLLNEFNLSLKQCAREINEALSAFERKIGSFKLSGLEPVKNDDESLDDEMCFIRDENSNSSSISSISHAMRKCYCGDDKAETMFNEQSEQFNLILKEYITLKHKILSFVRDCNQPVMFHRLQDVFEKLDIQNIAANAAYKMKCSTMFEAGSSASQPAKT